VSVDEVMTATPVIANRDLSVRDLAVLMRSWKVGSVIITDGPKAVGIVTERDMVEKVVSRDLRPSDVLASQIMTAELITAKPTDDLADAARLMTSSRVRRLPVVENGDLVGVLTENDVSRLAPGLLDLEAERASILARPTDEDRPSESSRGYCENCRNFSYDLRQTGGASGQGPLLCAECRELFVRDPAD